MKRHPKHTVKPPRWVKLSESTGGKNAEGYLCLVFKTRAKGYRYNTYFATLDYCYYRESVMSGETKKIDWRKRCKKHRKKRK